MGSIVGVPVWNKWRGEVGVLLEFGLDVVKWSLEWNLLGGGGEERERHEGCGGGEAHLESVDVRAAVVLEIELEVQTFMWRWRDISEDIWTYARSVMTRLCLNTDVLGGR